MKLTIEPVDDNKIIDIEVLESQSSITLYSDGIKKEIQIAIYNGAFVYRTENYVPWKPFLSSFCTDCEELFDDNPGKELCKTCENWYDGN